MKCWSCGSDLAGGSRHYFTCPLCSAVEEQKKIREGLESSGAQSLYVAVETFGPDLSEIAGILETGFGELSGELANIASILEWGFEEIEWKLDQIRGTLRSIDKTLKSPSRTQANEWRQIAEDLRRRRVLDESEKFFLKSLETNPLDYRTYIGIGKTYLQLGELKKARTYWGKSLPHAPKEGINYKSYSYRLIGRTYFCEEDYPQATSLLKTAIYLSPNYYLGHYDYAQYCALIGDKENCFSSLRIAVFGEPSLLELAERERNFIPLEKEIWSFLKEIKFGIGFWVRKKFGWDRFSTFRQMFSQIEKEIEERGFWAESRTVLETLEWDRFLEFIQLVKEEEEIKSEPEFRIILEKCGWDSFLSFAQMLKSIKNTEKLAAKLTQSYGENYIGHGFIELLLYFARRDFADARRIAIERGRPPFFWEEALGRVADSVREARYEIEHI